MIGNVNIQRRGYNGCIYFKNSDYDRRIDTN